MTVAHRRQLLPPGWRKDRRRYGPPPPARGCAPSECRNDDEAQPKAAFSVNERLAAAMPTMHNNSTTGYQWCVTTPEKTKSKGYLVAHQSINIPSTLFICFSSDWAQGGKLVVSGIDGKYEISGNDHVRVTQGRVVIEKGGAKQATSPMGTTLAVRDPPSSCS